MTGTKRLLLAVAAVLCAGMLRAEQQANYNFNFTHYSVEDGLSQNDVTTIIQDHKGFLWFGTWDGLCKFDSYHFTTYKAHPGDNSRLSTNRINFIYEDRLGYLWIQTYDNQVHRFDPESEQFYSLPDQLEVTKQAVQATNWFVETRDGEIWMVVRGGAVRLKSDRSEPEPNITLYSTQLGCSQVNSIFFDQENVWLCTDQGLRSIDPDGQTANYQPNPDPQCNNFTTAVVGDKKMYFGTADGTLWRYTKADIKFEGVALNCRSSVTDMALADGRYLIALTSRDGFYVRDIKSAAITHYSSASDKSIRSDNFYRVTIDSHGIAWLENDQQGIFRYRFTDQNLKHFQPRVDAVHSYSVQANHVIYEDIDNTLWVNPRGGGFSFYDRPLDQLCYFFNQPGAEDCHFSNVIHTAFSDRQGNLWLSTYNKGVEMISQSFSQFQMVKVSPGKSLTSNEVRSCCQTSSGQLFISTKEGYTRVYDTNFRELGLLCTDGSISTDERKRVDDMIYCMHEDRQHRLWLGSKGGGILLLTPHDNAFTLQRFIHDSSQPWSLSSNDVYEISEDSLGTIYVGTYGGGLNIVRPAADGSLRFVHPGNGLKGYPAQCMKVRDMAIDRDGTLWIASTDGLLQMEPYAPGRYRTYCHQREPENTGSLSNNDVHCLHIDRAGRLWAGTFGGGLNLLTCKATEHQKARFTAYTVEQGLFSDIVLSITEDKWGNLWFTSENAITKLSQEQGTFQSFNLLTDDRHDASGDYFSEDAYAVLSGGRLLFGCNQGCVVFAPDQMTSSSVTPALELTSLLLFNQPVRPQADGSPLKQSISYADRIEFNHKQDVFSIEYAALDFKGQDKIQYAYILKGFDSDWNYVHNQRRATYTNLPHGNYTFLVKSTNSEGVWCDNIRSVNIRVRPAPTETGWAYALYLLLALGLLFLVYWLSSRFASLRSKISVEQKVTEIKLRFFTNISHELRTPLSLIQGPVENVLHNEKITPAVREQLLVAQSNAGRMMRLINELLDFRKIQDNKLRLKVRQCRIYDEALNTYRNFTKEAADKDIRFTITDHTDNTTLWMDPEKFDVILYNLLSNAFKYTPNGRSVHIDLSEKNNFVLVKVTDEGVGIPKDKRGLLFERFTSNNEVQKANAKAGTGIGLNLVKELVDLHKGLIEVESELNSGTTFTVLLPKGKDHFDPQTADFVVEDATSADTALNALPLTDKLDHIQPSKDLPKMLVVEDNEEMSAFLGSIFRYDFNVLTAIDGQDGLAKAAEHMPEIIISDLMMPNMDGLDMTRAIKEDPRINHIPVILLTAKTAIEDRLNALQIGADDYITKPFSPVYLTQRVRNLLDQRERLRLSFRNQLLQLKPQEAQKTASPEEAFLAKLMDVMERNMDNNELTVDDLVSEMSLGRTVFFNKLKGLTGLSPVEFIREIRIKRAAQLLESGQYNITEITYMVGMNDSRYFSKCFKNAYGMTPSEYRKNLPH